MTTILTTVDMMDLRALVGPARPVASVYLGPCPSPPVVDSGEDLALRARAVASGLRADGADEPTVSIVAATIASMPVFATETALFAAHGEILARYDVDVGLGVGQGVGDFAAPPRLSALLSWLWRHPAHVDVITDRTGAEITAVAGGAAAGSTQTISGPDDEIERNAPGGWSQARYQRRAEDSWRHNAGAVADAVAHALDRVRADLLLLSGDVRAVQLLRERLPESVRHRVSVRDVPGARGPEGAKANRPASIDALLTAHAAKRRADLIATLHAQVAHAGAVEGSPATLGALADGRVDTLFVFDDRADQREAWFSDDLLCTPEATAGVDRRGRLVDVAIRAALLTGARVCVLEPGEASRLDGRIAALCRYPA